MGQHDTFGRPVVRDNQTTNARTFWQSTETKGTLPSVGIEGHGLSQCRKPVAPASFVPTKMILLVDSPAVAQAHSAFGMAASSSVKAQASLCRS